MYALKLLIASVDSAVNEYQPSGWGGALRQTEVLARGSDDSLVASRH